MSIGGIALPSASGAALGSGSASGDTTSVTISADGSSVTTVRDKKGEIVSISTTPRTRPPEPGSSAAASTKINITA